MSISRLAARVSALLFLLCVCVVIEGNWGYAQSINANLSGTVTDSSGAVIVGAKLTLTNAASKSTTTYESDDAGRYVFRDLEPGTYSLEVVSGLRHHLADWRCIDNQRVGSQRHRNEGWFRKPKSGSAGEHIPDQL